MIDKKKAEEATKRIMEVLNEFGENSAERKYILAFVQQAIEYETIRRALEVQFIMTPRSREGINNEIKKMSDGYSKLK